MAHGDLRLEVWSRPGSNPFERKDIAPPGPFSGTKRQANGVGRGQLTVPVNYERINDLIRRTPGDPGSDVRRLARVFAEGVTQPVFEFFLDVTSDELVETDITLSGASIDSMMSDAIVYPWDWDGSTAGESLWPDWIWNGRDILGPSQTTYKPTIFQVYTDAIGGSFQIQVSLNGGAFNFASINWDDNGFEVEQALETQLGNVDVVDVQGHGTQESPWEISILEPEGEYVAALGTESLTGGGAYLTPMQHGQIMPVGWTPSRVGTTFTEHGILTDFRASTGGGTDPALPPDCGSWIVFLGQEWFFPGVQRIVNVIPGGIYQVPPMWLYAQNGTVELRIVIRDLNENLIASEEINIASNTLTPTIGIADVRIPEGVTQVVFRIGHIGEGTPPRVFIGCPAMREGLAPTSAGGIMDALLDDATVNHTFHGRVVWENMASPGSTYLIPSFTSNTDSSGTSWDNMELDFVAKRGKNYQQVLADLANRGYRWSVTPNPISPFYWLNLYNPTWVKVDATALQSPAINVGSGVTSGPIVRSHLTGNVSTVEGLEMKFAREASQLSVNAIGRREVYNTDRTITTTEAAAVRAAKEVGIRLYSGLAIGLNVDPVNGPVPLVDYDVDWNVNVQVPPVVTKSAHRVAAITFAVADETRYQVSFSSEAFIGSAAVEEGTRRLLEKFEGFDEMPSPQAAPLAFGGGGDTTSGPTCIFSLPGQVFVEVGRLRFPFPFGGKVTWGVAACHIAPVGSDIIIDVNVNGTSVLAAGDRIVIPAGSNTSALHPISATLTPFQYVTIDVDQAGSSLAGGDLTVILGGPEPGGWLAT